MPELLDNTPFRELCLAVVTEHRNTWDGLAVEAGYRACPARSGAGRVGKRPTGVKYHQGEAIRLQRAIGYKPQGGRYQRRVSYELAVRIVRACGADPVDYGV